MAATKEEESVARFNRGVVSFGLVAIILIVLAVVPLYFFYYMPKQQNEIKDCVKRAIDSDEISRQYLCKDITDKTAFDSCWMSNQKPDFELVRTMHLESKKQECYHIFSKFYYGIPR